MCPELPQETVEEIVSYLHDDRASLFACSLSNSALVPVTRRYLFAEVIISLHQIKSAVCMLGDKHGTVAEAVRGLTIADQPPPNKGSGCVDVDCSENTLPDISSLRLRLQRLARLRFEHVCDSEIAPVFWELANGLCGVQEVQVDQMFCDSSERFFAFMSSLPALERFAVSRSHWSGLDSKLDFPRSQSFRHVSLLDIGPFAQNHVLQWLLTHQVALSVQVLRLNLAIDLETALLVKRLVDIVGCNLHELHISLMNGVYDIEMLDFLDFGNCSNIRSLHIEARHDPQGQELVEDFIETLFPQFSSSTSLKEISWSISIDQHKSMSEFIGLTDEILLRRFYWQTLSDALGVGIGDGLERLRIQVENYPERLHKRTEGYLTGVCFPELTKHGKLELAFVVPGGGLKLV
ncbi:hypothetical protein AX17_004890 [Amanita inopinata Kibby_2008]|nr:hypothetical protein AX17_004890 [Amanita inopinata Kibby_2008]